MTGAGGLCVVRTADALTPSSLLPAKRSLMSVILLKIKDQTGEAIFPIMPLGKFIR